MRHLVRFRTVFDMKSMRMMRARAGRLLFVQRPALRLLFVVVLGLMALGCTQSSSEGKGSPGDVVEVPDSHPAFALLNEADTFGTFMETASEHQILAGCSSRTWSASHAPAGVTRLEYCLVPDGDVLAVVSFDNPDGVVAKIDGDGLGGEVSVALDEEDPIGVHSAGGELVVVVERDGEYITSEPMLVESNN